jgi:hypothetical protein
MRKSSISRTGANRADLAPALDDDESLLRATFCVVPGQLPGCSSLLSIVVRLK